MANMEKFWKLVSPEVSGVMKKAEWMEANKNWLDYSGDIALEILHVLDKKNLTKKDLSKLSGISLAQISKIVSGNQNISLKTISKIEQALGIKLITITDSENQ